MRPLRRQTILIGIFLVLVVFFVLTFRMGIVRGDSMLPTYKNGQVVLVLRRNNFSSALKRGDVVVLRKDRDVIIKRIYRLPGEEITDPELLRYTFAYDLRDYYEQPIAPKSFKDQPRLFVPEGYVVLLGDNKRVSEDSRLFGPVPLRDILGTVVASPPAPDAKEEG